MLLPVDGRAAGRRQLRHGRADAGRAGAGRAPDRPRGRRQRLHRRRRRPVAGARRPVAGPRGEPVRPGGAGLRDVAALDLAGLHWPGSGSELVLAGDVDNPLPGRTAQPMSTARRRARAPEVAVLDAGLGPWAAVVAAVTARQPAPGAGAAGGLGFGAMGVLGDSRPGIEVVLDLMGFEAGLRRGARGHRRGALDEQSLKARPPPASRGRPPARGSRWSLCPGAGR